MSRQSILTVGLICPSDFRDQLAGVLSHFDSALGGEAAVKFITIVYPPSSDANNAVRIIAESTDSQYVMFIDPTVRFEAGALGKITETILATAPEYPAMIGVTYRSIPHGMLVSHSARWSSTRVIGAAMVAPYAPICPVLRSELMRLLSSPHWQKLGTQHLRSGADVADPIGTVGATGDVGLDAARTVSPRVGAVYRLDDSDPDKIIGVRVEL